MSKLITVANPGEIDGTPYEVSTKSIRQVAVLVAEARNLLMDANPMLLNAEMQRALDFGNDDDLPRIAMEWDDGTHPQAKEVMFLLANCESLIKRLANLSRAVGYDPKHPPTE